MSDEWVETTLERCAKIVGGGTPSTKVPEYWGGDVVWLAPTEVVKQDGMRIATSERTITATGLSASSAKLLPRNTVLVTTRASVGFTAITDTELATNQGFQSLIPEPGVLPEFLMMWVQANRDAFQSRASGSTFPEISKTKVRTIPISLPPLSVQARIVDLLERLDTQIANLEQEREALLTLLHSCLEIWIRSPKDRVRFRDEVTLQRGFDLPVQDRQSGSVPIIASNGVVGDHSVAKVEGPGVVTGRSGTIGKVIFVEGNFWPLNTTLYVKDFHGNSPAYIRHLLASMNLASHAGGSTVPSLNRNVLDDVQVHVPDPGRQRKIAAQLDSIIDSAAAIEYEAGTLRAVRSQSLNSLLSREIEIPETYDELLGVAS